MNSTYISVKSVLEETSPREQKVWLQYETRINYPCRFPAPFLLLQKKFTDHEDKLYGVCNHNEFRVLNVTFYWY